ncbi:MAG TPA: hypothetical protein VMJ10_16170 [Kofleriaceae bacterium]|nr:hypothetical protein [Kofleriaceae bacterium]
MKRLAIAFVVLALASGVALADDKAECDFLEIGASVSKPASLPDELKPLEKKLQQPPLSSYSVFALESKGHVQLAKLKPDALKIVRGHATVLLRDRHDKRIELTMTLDDAKGKRVLESKQSVSAGDWNVWVHSDGPSSGHIIALMCK